MLPAAGHYHGAHRLYRLLHRLMIFHSFFICIALKDHLMRGSYPGRLDSSQRDEQMIIVPRALHQLRCWLSVAASYQDSFVRLNIFRLSMMEMLKLPFNETL